MKNFYKILCLVCFGVQTVRCAIKTDPENQRVVDDIERISDAVLNNAGRSVPLFTENWKKSVEETNVYAHSKNSTALKKYAPVITEAEQRLKIVPGEKKANEQREKLVSEALKSIRTFKESTVKEIYAIRNSPITSKEKRWAVERYKALLEALEKIALQLSKAPKSGVQFKETVEERQYIIGDEPRKMSRSQEKPLYEGAQKPIGELSF